MSRKFTHKKNKKRLGLTNKASYESFKDILNCPVCTQVKPVDEFTYREIEHMKKHVKNPVVE